MSGHLSDAELGAAVRRLLNTEGVLASLTLRRGHDDGHGSYVATLHVHASHVDVRQPELGNVCEGVHRREVATTIEAALERLG